MAAAAAASPVPSPTSGGPMNRFTRLEAVAAPILIENIDTDVIIRIERLCRNGIRGTLAPWCFGALRYRCRRLGGSRLHPQPAALPRAQIILGGRNFGCGSSREGAVWSLPGARRRPASSPRASATSSSHNCFQNGILPVVLDEGDRGQSRPWSRRARAPARSRSISRNAASSRPPAAASPSRSRPSARGLAAGARRDRHDAPAADAIARFQERDRRARPWVYAAAG